MPRAQPRNPSPSLSEDRSGQNGENVVVKGSEQIKGWEHQDGDVWLCHLPNNYFGSFNPFANEIRSDWFFPLENQQGVDKKLLSGTTQNDITKEYLSRGTYIFPPRPSLKLSTDIIHYTTMEVPKWNPINICSYHLQEAGATP